MKKTNFQQVLEQCLIFHQVLRAARKLILINAMKQKLFEYVGLNPLHQQHEP